MNATTPFLPCADQYTLPVRRRCVGAGRAIAALALATLVPALPLCDNRKLISPTSLHLCPRPDCLRPLSDRISRLGH